MIVLTQSKIAREALLVWCEEARIGRSNPIETIVFENGGDNSTLEQEYFDLCRLIEVASEDLAATEFGAPTVVVGGIDGSALKSGASPLSLTAQGTAWDSLVAMLIQTFPEIRWLFGVVSNSAVTDRYEANLFPKSDHELDAVFDQTRDPLFDATGLRDWIREQTNDDLKRMAEEAARNNEMTLLHSPFQVPRRSKRAVVIEDETDFAMMHGYAAYRFGFRTEVVTSWQQMRSQFQSPGFEGEEVPKEERHKYQLILEDMRLQFADKPAAIPLSKPEDRARHCNLLADENDDSDFRFMISTGQEATADDLWATNKWHLDNKRCGFGKLLMKPVGGPLALWRETDLRNQLHDGQAHGFVSPPAEVMDDLYDGHGAPGKLALVASTMIDRARRVLVSADTPREYLLAAVLAGDAFELLGGKTPTLSLEAIKLKHVSEVRAECAFIGAGFHADLTDRFDEIHRDVASVGRWYHPKQRGQAELDAKTTIYNELIKVYRDVGQMEEENQCLMQFRSLNRKLERPKGFWRFNPFSWSLHVIVSYGEWLMGQFWRIAFASAVWLFAFVLFAWLMDGQKDFAKHLARQLNWMSGGTSETTLFLAWLSSAANVVGVFHFGILVSYLYSLISRK